jgi:glycosyltransferase involved in cell wall biosynthesis
MVPELGIDVQILSECDNGSISVGKKRQNLLDRSQGDYLAFIDDDDRVSSSYLSRISEALQDSPDCVGMQGIVTFDGKRSELFEHSIRHPKWERRCGVYYRYPNHLNPVRRDLALKVGFKDLRVGEDFDYSNRLRPLISTEYFIHEPIYFYDYISNK